MSSIISAIYLLPSSATSFLFSALATPWKFYLLHLVDTWTYTMSSVMVVFRVSEWAPALLSSTPLEISASLSNNCILKVKYLRQFYLFLSWLPYEFCQVQGLFHFWPFLILFWFCHLWRKLLPHFQVYRFYSIFHLWEKVLFLAFVVWIAPPLTGYRVFLLLFCNYRPIYRCISHCFFLVNNFVSSFFGLLVTFPCLYIFGLPSHTSLCSPS